MPQESLWFDLVLPCLMVVVNLYCIVVATLNHYPSTAWLSYHRQRNVSCYTSHHLISQPASKDSISGSFGEGSNT
jgi:hypothetical protein